MAEGAEEPGESLHAADEELAAARADGDPLRLAQALVARAVCLQRLRRRTEALATIDEVIDAGFDVTEFELRKRVADALWLRLSMRWRDADAHQSLAAARELFALCNQEPVLERTAASALGVQADAQRRLGDLRAAIATRRWLISEFADVRPRNRPDLVFDQWFRLAGDLYADDQPAETVRTCTDLIAALEDAEVSAPQTRIADALRWQLQPLWELRETERSRAVFDELQQRFAKAEEPRARHAAASALASMAERRLYERDVVEALALAAELLTRFVDERDATTRTHIAEQLQHVTDTFTVGFGPKRLMFATSLAAPVRTRRRAAALLRRRRLRPVAGMLAQLECSARLTEVLRAAFERDESAPGRAIFGRTILDGAVASMRGGRAREGLRGFEAFSAQDPSVISAVVTSARAIGPDRYRLTDWVAALLATGIPLDPGREAETRSAIRGLLHSRTVPAARRVAELQLRTMDRSAR